MQPLFAVHNNVSLLSVTIAPSTFLASLTLVLVFFALFIALYIPRLPFLSRIFRSGQRRNNPPHPQVFEPAQISDSRNFGYLSTHSGFLETDTESMRDSVSVGGYSPPAWRRLGNGDRSSGFWRNCDNILGSPTMTPAWSPSLLAQQRPVNTAQYQQYQPDRQSREWSPGFSSADEDVIDPDDDVFGNDDDDEEILAQAMRTRLPRSMSPEKELSPEAEDRMYLDTAHRTDDIENQREKPPELELSENYIRFAVRAEVQQRTEPIEAAINFARNKFLLATRSWAHVFCSMIVAMFSVAAMRWLSQPASMRMVPDLVKVAGIARAFEPLIFYSENGVAQVGDLQATGIAVWDLGESVRSSNLTSAPIIVRELDELSETLKTLAIELTKFFANVDGDIDGILIVMDWARRELSQLQMQERSQQRASLPPVLTSAYDNIHNLLSSAGVLENAATGLPTRMGSVTMALFGMSGPQRTRATLRRTFHEFLAVLEEAVSSELQHSLALFGLFEAVDHQFLNLARTAAREASVQEDLHTDLLTSLWTRILGPNAAEVKKYEKNRELLRDVRAKTVRNKGILVEHNHRLLALKASLESLRRKLVSPLVRSVNSSTLTLEQQVRGLEDVGSYLEGVRTRQKGKLMEMLYGSGRSTAGSLRHEDAGHLIEEA
ncbi:hypothetical protein CMQ_1447 [Grosmannia clavigera kw1407]|uniref:Uncharacterized protein n=1 Tax=Grosmannia clavigera (strain kw1407 / UAMH 11150) TaxID=655863 RepID=F0XBX3_GROCL|nr:uncharacterized protein CMQ_1447 [Grosmannia clavigera kw1407]EFX04519.1 hypothetical protein CMQ_1447 [Grosmannia clavigera kw1407]